MKSKSPARSMVGESTRRLDGLYWDKHDDPAWSTGGDELLPGSKLAGVS